MAKDYSKSSFKILVDREKLPLFTTLLQTGIEVETTTTTSLGGLLAQIKGFTADYLADTVQTIFLDGTAVDDLTLLLAGSNPVLALSGAMPGLAGAIFRKNSFHAALRTDTAAAQSQHIATEPNCVTLKLFNRVARERGLDLLQRGVTVKGANVLSFFSKRSDLWPYIHRLESAGHDISQEKFLEYASISDTLGLCITHDNDATR